MMGVYLIHFSEPFGHARHYLGWSTNIKARFAQHKKGKGARLCEVVVKAGIKLKMVRTWPGHDRTFERKLHGRGKSILCPICNPQGWNRNYPVRNPLDDDVEF